MGNLRANQGREAAQNGIETAWRPLWIGKGRGLAEEEREMVHSRPRLGTPAQEASSVQQAMLVEQLKVLRGNGGHEGRTLGMLCHRFAKRKMKPRVETDTNFIKSVGSEYSWHVSPAGHPYYNWNTFVRNRLAP